MSGLPVYVGGRLLGAVAYGFGTASGTASVVGLTPADDMLGILAYPTAATIGRRAVGTTRRTIALSTSARQAVARGAGVPVGQVASAMTRLRLPFSVSGLGDRGMRAVDLFLARRGLALVAHGGPSASGTASAAAEPLEPGDSFAAVTSYGDVTTAGMGTTTYVCAGRALAFGHPLLLSGPTSAGASAAHVLAVVSDPAVGAFKLATVGASLGRIDQDRGAGVRALLGSPPPATAIRTNVFAPSGRGRREGATDVVEEDVAPFVTFLHALSNVDSAFDAIGRGASSLSWTMIEGTRASGAPWQLIRSNVYASRGDIAVESASEVAGQLALLAETDLDEVRVTGVRLNPTVRERLKGYTVKRVLVASGRARLRARDAVQARPGSRLRIGVVLEPFERGARRTVDLGFRLPKARGVAYLEVGGAGVPGEAYGCFLYAEFEEECVGELPGIDSFDGLLRFLQRLPRNDVLAADLQLLRQRKTRHARAGAVTS